MKARPHDLFVPLVEKARTHDRATAKRAAKAAFPRQASQRHRILAAIVESADGLTYDQASDETGIVAVSASTRISELAAGGWVEPNGERKTFAGGSATVWVATDRSRRELNESAAAREGALCAADSLSLPAEPPSETAQLSLLAVA